MTGKSDFCALRKCVFDSAKLSKCEHENEKNHRVKEVAHHLSDFIVNSRMFGHCGHGDLHLGGGREQYRAPIYRGGLAGLSSPRRGDYSRLSQQTRLPILGRRRVPQKTGSAVRVCGLYPMRRGAQRRGYLRRQTGIYPHKQTLEAVA